MLILSLFIKQQLWIFSILLICTYQNKIHTRQNAKAPVSSEFRLQLIPQIGFLIIKEFHFLTIRQSIIQIHILGRDKDGTLNEEYCKWCYADGTYTYNDMDELIDVCVKNMVNESFTEEQARTYLKEMLPKLDYWKRYDELSDNGQFEEFKKQLINEINDLHIDGLPRVDKLNALVGKYVNLEYTLPNEQKVKFLDDEKTYLGNQLESEFGGDRCFGILASMDFILICTYEKAGENPELLIYKKR